MYTRRRRCDLDVVAERFQGVTRGSERLSAQSSMSSHGFVDLWQVSTEFAWGGSESRMCSRSEDDDALRVSCCSGIGAGAAGRKWMDSAGDEGMSHTRSGSRSSAVFSAS